MSDGYDGFYWAGKEHMGYVMIGGCGACVNAV